MVYQEQHIQYLKDDIERGKQSIEKARLEFSKKFDYHSKRITKKYEQLKEVSK